MKTSSKHSNNKKTKEKKPSIDSKNSIKDTDIINKLYINTTNSDDNSLTKVIIKFFILSFLFAIYFIFIKDKKTYFDLTKTHNNIFDAGLEIYLKPYTNFIIKDFFYKDLTQIAGALLLDTLFILSAILIPLYAIPTRDMLTFILFYGIRGLLLNLFDIPILINCNSKTPSIYSISTPYGRGNDYFYSGHTGSALNMSILFYRYNHRKLFWWGLFVTMVQGYVMTVTKQHLCIDVIVGFCLAHYFSILSQKVQDLIFKKESVLTSIEGSEDNCEGYFDSGELSNELKNNSNYRSKNKDKSKEDLSLDSSKSNTSSRIFNIFNIFNINDSKNNSKNNYNNTKREYSVDTNNKNKNEDKYSVNNIKRVKVN